MQARIASQSLAGPLAPSASRPVRLSAAPHQPRDVTARVTNTGRELKHGKGDDENKEEDKYIYVSQMQTLDNKRPLERSVSLVFEDAIFLKEGDEGYDDEQHRNYWFKVPEGGWNQEMKKLEILPYVPEEEMGNYWPKMVATPGEDRLSLHDIKVGSEIHGEIYEINFAHGIFVDFGAEAQGWISMEQEGWTRMIAEKPDLHTRLLPGNKIKCRVHRVCDPVVYRFPVVLEALEPQELLPYITPISSLGAAQLPIIMKPEYDLEEFSHALGREFDPDYQMPEPVLPAYVKEMLVVDDDLKTEDDEGNAEKSDLAAEAAKQYGLLPYQIDQMVQVLKQKEDIVYGRKEEEQ